MKIKKSMKKRLTNKYLFYGIGLVIVLLVFCFVFLAINITGSSVYAKYYGVTDQVMSTQEGIKTYLEISQPDLKTIVTPEGRLKIATMIAETTDIPDGLYDLYLANPDVPTFFLAELAVKEALDQEDINMAEYLACIKKTTRNNYNQKELKMVLVSELLLNSCQKGLWYAHTKHTFYDPIRGAIICSSESGKLFLIDYFNNEISMDFSKC